MLIRVLLIEDDQADAFLIREMLSESLVAGKQGEVVNAAVQHVKRLDEGIRQAADGRFDIIISDLGLPDSQGLATVKKLAAAVRHIPIVVLTGQADQEFGFATVNAGTEDYLVKGQVDANLLMRAIRYAIERGKLIAKLHEAFAQIKTLRGLIPICSSCKNIRDDQGFWQQVESYVRDHTEAEFSHGICPNCLKTLYPQFADKILAGK